MISHAAAPYHVLVVDDEAADARLARYALKAGKYPCEVHVVQDGVEALAFLRRQPPYADAPVPRLVLLDLNMPRKNGLETLSEIKADPALKCTPVVVMTTSDFDGDISASYDKGANSFATKPVELDDFARLIESIKEYWFNTVRLPPLPAP